MPRPPTRRPARKRAGQYHHGGLRDALIQATVATIQRDGVDAVTLRAVGAVLGEPPREAPGLGGAGALPLDEGDDLVVVPDQGVEEVTFLTGCSMQVEDIPLPGGEVYALGSALLFDLGVYFGVSGAGMAILFSLESQGKKMLPS